MGFFLTSTCDGCWICSFTMADCAIMSEVPGSRSLRGYLVLLSTVPHRQRSSSLYNHSSFATSVIRAFHPEGHKWSQVPDDVSRVVTKWLVEQVLDQFFVLLKDTAFDKHWRYREAFWRAFHDEGLIDDICFVLGGNAAMRLRKVSKDPILVKTTGTLVGAQSDQSVLILRLPGVTIAEWSHNGSCHMWLDGMDGAPVLREKEYHVNQVRRRYPYLYRIWSLLATT